MSFKDLMITDVGKLNKLTRDNQYFWGIRKNSWEDFYHLEVSSQNFDNRPSYHETCEYIDEAILNMLNFCELNMEKQNEAA